MRRFTKQILPLIICAMLCSCTPKTSTTPDKPTESKSAVKTDKPMSAKNVGTDDSPNINAKGLDPIYDVEPIVKAYKENDEASLDDLQKKILARAKEIIGEIINDGMTDYEKELAVHDWLIANCTYDSGAMAAIPKPSENSDNPYGALVNGSAICSGYTSSFKLLMNMLDIDCGIIHSTDDEGDEHAWNVLKLDDSWYYVDCTWDDPVPDKDGRPITHRYFNVSDKFIMSDHVLPEGSPKTDSDENSYILKNAADIEELSDIAKAVDDMYKRNHDSVSLRFQKDKFDLSGEKLGDFYFYLNDGEVSDAVEDAAADKKMAVLTMNKIDSDGKEILVVQFYKE